MGKTVNTRAIVEVRAWRLALADFTYGLSPDLIAHTLSLTRNQATEARSSAAYQARMEELKSDMNRRMEREFGADAEKIRLSLSSHVPQAMEVLVKSLKDPDPNVRLRAAQEILDRDGRLPKVSKVQNEQKDSKVLPIFEPGLLAEFHIEKMN